MIGPVMIDGVAYWGLTRTEEIVLFAPFFNLERAHVPSLCEAARQDVVPRVRALGRAWGTLGTLQPQLHRTFEEAPGAPPIVPEVVLPAGIIDWAIRLQSEWADILRCAVPPAMASRPQPVAPEPVTPGPAFRPFSPGVLSTPTQPPPGSNAAKVAVEVGIVAVVIAGLVFLVPWKRR